MRVEFSWMQLNFSGVCIMPVREGNAPLRKKTPPGSGMSRPGLRRKLGDPQFAVVVGGGDLNAIRMDAHPTGTSVRQG